MDNNINPIKITIKKGLGITHALRDLVKSDSKYKISDGSITSEEWLKTIKVLDEINANRKANNQASIFKTTQRMNYIVYTGQEIEFTAEETAKLFEAMGVELNGTNNNNNVNDIDNNNEIINNNNDEDNINNNTNNNNTEPTEDKRPVVKGNPNIDAIKREFENAPTNNDGFKVLEYENGATKQLKVVDNNKIILRITNDSQHSHLPANSYTIEKQGDGKTTIERFWSGIVQSKLTLTPDGRPEKISLPLNPMIHDAQGQNECTYNKDGSLTFIKKEGESKDSGTVKLAADNSVESLSGERTYKNPDTNELVTEKYEWNSSTKELKVTNTKTNQVTTLHKEVNELGNGPWTAMVDVLQNGTGIDKNLGNLKPNSNVNGDNGNNGNINGGNNNNNNSNIVAIAEAPLVNPMVSTMSEGFYAQGEGGNSDISPHIPGQWKVRSHNADNTKQIKDMVSTDGRTYTINWEHNGKVAKSLIIEKNNNNTTYTQKDFTQYNYDGMGPKWNNCPPSMLSTEQRAQMGITESIPGTMLFNDDKDVPIAKGKYNGKDVVLLSRLSVDTETRTLTYVEYKGQDANGNPIYGQTFMQEEIKFVIDDSDRFTGHFEKTTKDMRTNPQNV